ncbi:MAG TPA: SprT family zinc-dependent metalloprotease [Nitrospirota bacterium]
MRNIFSKKKGPKKDSGQLDLFSQPAAPKASKAQKTREADVVAQPVWSVVLGGRRVAYTLRRSARSRNVWLRFGIGTGLEVVAPMRMSMVSLESVIAKKSRWLLNQLDRAGVAERVRKAREPRDGAVLPYMGTEYTLRVELAEDASVRISGDEIHAALPDASVENLREVLREWYKKMARVVIPERVNQLSNGKKVGSVSIRDQKTRWGSCSSKGNLSFNWRLAMAPPRIIDYMIIHELCHLDQPDHSAKYWAKVEKLCPDYKEREAWLKEHGRGLHV